MIKIFLVVAGNVYSNGKPIITAQTYATVKGQGLATIGTIDHEFDISEDEIIAINDGLRIDKQNEIARLHQVINDLERKVKDNE